MTLRWSTSTDNVAVSGYKVYRDGTRIGFAQTNSFEDTSVAPDTVYTYEVSAYDAAGNESPLDTVFITSSINQHLHSHEHWIDKGLFGPEA